MRLAALLIAAVAAPAGAQELPIALPSEAGWTMSAERQLERTRQGQAPQTSRFTSTADVAWKAGGEGGVVSLRVRSAEVDAAGAMAFDVRSLMNEEVVLDVDASLAPTRVRNWPQVRATLDATVDKAVADPAAASATKGIFANLTPEQAAQLVARDWALVTLAQGSALKLGEPVSYQGQLPNPMGGPPIDAVGTFELKAYDAAGGRAVVEWKQAFDPKSAADSVAQALSAMAMRMAPDKAKEAEAALRGMEIRREDACRHEIDIPTGLALKVVCTSAITTRAKGETATNLDRWTITQTRPQPSAKLN